MVKSCYVPFCKVRDGEKTHKFRPPENMVEVWDRIIKRADVRLTRNHYVCSKHFESRFINVEDVIKIKKGLIKNNGEIVGDNEIISYPKEKPRLLHGAIPTIFKGYPSYYQKTPKPPRKEPKKREPLQPKAKLKHKNYQEINDGNIVGKVPEPIVLHWNENMKWNIPLTVVKPIGWHCDQNSEAIYFFCGFLEGGNFISSKTVTFYKQNINLPAVKIMAMSVKVDQPCYTVSNVERLLTIIDGLAGFSL